ncbi:carboxymuconolactone decarboxylase family protein [Poseidonocella sp. HB161398]|uniref:carboxymuconolactone decarboxylase family protein n=1 Tax=Poseidonocella sp. HB161398 TaxID=2320855 RepID=UPI001108F331|nr:carboxymuconolactone decarboxylase family protein [Poseidonocella sp. HB161398]
MAEFTRHTLETAPEASKPLVENAIAMFGMLPNLTATMAESPQLLEVYQLAHIRFQETSFTPAELNTVWLAINVEHACHYCVPAHTGIAHRMGVDPEVIEALRTEAPLPDAKLEALRGFTLAMVRGRGVVSDDEMQAFFAAGYTRKHVLEVILGIAQKVMSNYVNHVAQTPVDAPFAKFAWDRRAPEPA